VQAEWLDAGGTTAMVMRPHGACPSLMFVNGNGELDQNLRDTCVMTLDRG
jgi:hypothetical protein